MNRLRLLAAGLSASVLLAGCGGTKLNSNVARIRAINGAAGTTAAATIYINNGSANGDQTYEQVTQYLYVNSGTSTFSWNDNLSSGGLSSSFPVVLESGQSYSAILFGDAGLQVGNTAPFLDITEDNQTTPTAGDAAIRLIPDAPDAGTVDVYVNHVLTVSAFPYPGTTLQGIPPGVPLTTDPFSTQTFSYISVPAGSVTVQYTKTGTTTPLGAAQTFNVQAGRHYSFFLMEPTVTPTPSYTIFNVGDDI